jgi:hypothetical protein
MPLPPSNSIAERSCDVRLTTIVAMMFGAAASIAELLPEALFVGTSLLIIAAMLRDRRQSN